MWRFGIFALVAVVLILGIAALAAVQLNARFHAPGPLEQDSSVVIARGGGLNAVAKQLAEAGVIGDALTFELGTRYLGVARDLKAGEFAFPAGVSMRGALDILISGKSVQYRLTVPEGLTSPEIIKLIAAAPRLEGDLEEVPPDGSLLPETYHFSRGDTRAALLKRMQNSMKAAIAELWPKRRKNLPIKTPEEALVLASIVEKETSVDAERPLVAGVFINRLRKGMPLQSDPTVVYGITLGKAPLGRSLTRKDLKTPSPYNTYTIPALPPGPITNPGRQSLEAVLNPADTEFIFFVADGTGGHAFAKTLREHNNNVAKWRKVQKKQKSTQ